jgi:hypothetical protein
LKCETVFLQRSDIHKVAIPLLTTQFSLHSAHQCKANSATTDVMPAILFETEVRLGVILSGGKAGARDMT